MRPEAQVVEFVIISGPEVHDYLLDIRAQLRSYLNRAFPHFRFSLVSQDGEGMGFIVVPVVGTVGGDDCDAEWADPDVRVLGEIREALEAFRPEELALH